MTSKVRETANTSSQSSCSFVLLASPAAREGVLEIVRGVDMCADIAALQEV